MRGMEGSRLFSGALRGSAIGAFHLACGFFLLTVFRVPQPLLSASTTDFSSTGSAAFWGLVLGAPGFLAYFALLGAIGAKILPQITIKILSTALSGITTVAALILMSSLCQKLDYDFLTSGFAPAFIFGGPAPIALTGAFASLCSHFNWPQ
jgi:hypothetical protein